ncbi:MAG: CoA transferase [Rhodospirillales bacterium CG15_BIG_FIL_POST_REV_8_21_14_020_66_15]|nr:MAG: CoA transferase [Rhodospirillales bacterium CG15_BIG_FIL_POST_REV_8_21_14_020_66_15]
MTGGLPLSGVRILDASHVLAGPFATYQLCLMGADAVRVERIGGDDFVRHHGGSAELRTQGMGGSFAAQNAGKACILLDLKAPGGRDVFLKLAAACDVVMENYRPGVMDRLGVGYADVKAMKPDIVYCSLTGYGPQGPFADAPAYDHIVQGVSGLMSMTGTKDSGPQRMGLPITDYIAGLTAALAVAGALHQKRATGEGQHLVVPMLASVLAFMGSYAIDAQTLGRERGLQGNAPFSGSPFAGRFDTVDGHLVVTANTAAQAVRMVRALGLADLEPLAAGTAPDALSEADRARVAEALDRTFRTRTALEWEEALGAAAVPAGKVRGLGEILAHPQTAAMGCLDDLPLPGLEDPVKLPGLGFTSDAWTRRPLSEPEAPGQSTRDVLAGLGLSRREIDDLARAGAVAGPGLPPRSA